MPPRDHQLRWPGDFIEDATVSITPASFESDIRTYRPADEALTLIQPDELEWLFRTTKEYLQKREGIPALRRARVVEDLRRCQALIQAESNLGDRVRLLQRSARGRFPWAAAYAREILAQTDPAAIEEINSVWLEELRTQIFWASKLRVQGLKQAFTTSVEFYLRKVLLRARRDGKPLGRRTQQRYVQSLIGAVLVKAGEMNASADPRYSANSLRQHRFVSRQPKPGDISEIDVITAEELRQLQRRVTKKKRKAVASKTRPRTTKKHHAETKARSTKKHEATAQHRTRKKHPRR